MSTSGDQLETITYEEEEEIEVTDDEVEVATEDQSEEEHVEETSVPKTPPKKPGKVKPSEEVRKMDMKSPETAGKSKRQALPTNKNPFTTFGTWTDETMSEIEIVVPMLSGKNETTNELTRGTRPEARYWRAPIVFKYRDFVSTTLRFDNVHIPFHTAKGYGSNFVYLCLPGFAAGKFAEAAKARRPTVVHERSLQPDRNRWWKVANNVDESFGVIKGGRFQKKSLEVIFDATSSGITASVVLSFLFKANTDSTEPLKPTTAGTISVVLERGYINATDVNVEMPVRLNNKKAKVEPIAAPRDVADDSLLKRLAELGL